MYEYGHLGGGYIKSTLYTRFLIRKKETKIRKNKVFTGKTPFYAIGRFCTTQPICLNTDFLQSSFLWT